MAALAAIAVGLFGVTFFAYAPVLDAGFLGWDDPLHITDNVRIRSFSAANLRWMLTSTEAHNWHPLVWLSHAADYAVFGLEPWGHHLGNVLIHCLNTLWVFALGVAVLQMVRGSGPWSLRAADLLPENVAAAAAAALLFGVHPQHVESVAWVSERKDVLCLFFVFPSLLAYFAYAKAPAGRRRLVYYSLSLLFYVFAVMSKAMAVTLPAVLLVLDLYPLQRLPEGARRWPDAEGRRLWARILLEKLPYGLVTVIASGVAVLAQGEGVAGFENTPKGFRILNAFESLVFYIEKMLWPADLSTYYAPQPGYIGFWHGLPEYWLPIGLVGLASVACLVAWSRGRPLWLAVWLFYLVTLAPVIGIIQVGGQAAADRYAYLPTIPLYLLIGVALGRLLFRQGALRWGTALALVAVTGVLVSQTRAQTLHWHDDVAFWESAHRASPHSPLVNLALGSSYRSAGNHEGAIATFRLLVEVDPGPYQNHFYLAEAYRSAGRLDEALDALEPIAQVLRERGEHGIYSVIAREACGEGRFDVAARAVETARELDPRDRRARRLADEIRSRSCR